MEMENRTVSRNTLAFLYKAMFVAYLMSGLTGQDLQFVAATGVSDTMQDMICCLIGTVAFLPSAIRLSRGRGDWLTGAVSDFIQENYGSN